jgi:hypothetical protein
MLQYNIITSYIYELGLYALKYYYYICEYCVYENIDKHKVVKETTRKIVYLVLKIRGVRVCYVTRCHALEKKNGLELMNGVNLQSIITPRNRSTVLNSRT